MCTATNHIMRRTDMSAVYGQGETGLPASPFDHRPATTLPTARSPEAEGTVLPIGYIKVTSVTLSGPVDLA